VISFRKGWTNVPDQQQVTIDPGWIMANALASVARGRGWDVSAADGTAAALSVDGRPVEVPEGSSLDRLRVEVMLGAIIDGLRISPEHVTATVIAPAAGVCGPASAGPVDSVRVEGLWSGDTLAARPIGWSARVVAAQQSRCWLISAGFTGPWPDGPLATGDLSLLPSMVATDTARSCQFQLDRGHGVDWPEVVLLDAPCAAGGQLEVLAACTDGLLAARLLDEAASSRDEVLSA
jgi:hypothetical protein